ncbi:hypothetical protein INT43_005298 [Umbelopsis isabellina]|uniref:FHA domain-containing protein n=1 Tax=Mortierella isabellina TaxID=91625 RepID=A0A8H7PHD7_MORIS|nr:hypothetical protein INT43_005298 [Umbelopsis isabellina]
MTRPRPKLAGFSWTHYITYDNVILGRSQSNDDSDVKDARHVSFGTSKAISRKHAEIKHDTIKDRWELYVYGRNGVKLNGLFRKPPCKPVVLETGALIDIDGNQFVFVLPVSANSWNSSTTADKNLLTRSTYGDETIESLIVDAIESTTFDVTAKNIYEYIDTKRKNELLPPIALDRVTQILLDNPQFQLAPGCIDGTSPDAVWTIVSDNDPVDFHESQDPPSQQLLRREASFQRETFSKSVVSARDALGIEWFYVISLDVNSQPTKVNIQRDYERFSQLQFGEALRFHQSRKRSFDDYGIEPRALKRIRTTEYMIEREVSTASLTVSDILDLGELNGGV